MLDQTMSFRCFQSQPSVQILDDSVAHWVVISAFNCKPDEIMLLCISKSRYALLWTVKKEKSKLRSQAYNNKEMALA